jgi:large subunit ribosomal protein L5
MRLKELYKKEIMPKMKEKFGYKNNFAVPALYKITINIGLGKHSKDKAYIDAAINNLKLISGQKPVANKAKKSISAFKIREGMTVGASVVLRKDRMYDFVEKLVGIVFPRVRDFRGIDEKIIDKTGNLSVGFKEHTAFGEIKSDDIENIHGLEVNISTTAKTREEGLELFRLMGFPFKK